MYLIDLEIYFMGFRNMLFTQWDIELSIGNSTGSKYTLDIIHTT